MLFCTGKHSSISGQYFSLRVQILFGRHCTDYYAATSGYFEHSRIPPFPLKWLLYVTSQTANLGNFLLHYTPRKLRPGRNKSIFCLISPCASREYFLEEKKRQYLIKYWHYEDKKAPWTNNLTFKVKQDNTTVLSWTRTAHDAQKTLNHMLSYVLLTRRAKSQDAVFSFIRLSRNCQSHYWACKPQNPAVSQINKY